MIIYSLFIGCVDLLIVAYGLFDMILTLAIENFIAFPGIKVFRLAKLFRVIRSLRAVRVLRTIRSLLCSLPNCLQFLADRTNDGAYGTVLCLSVCLSVRRLQHMCCG